MKENCKKEEKKNKQRQKTEGGTENIVKRSELNDFVVGFLQLICKDSSIFQSNLELLLL